MYKKVTIPTTQSEITLRQYIEAQGKPEAEQLAIYLDITKEVLDMQPQSFYDDAHGLVAKALAEPQDELQQRFKIGHTEYGFYPNLNEIESGAFAVADNAFNKVEHATEFMTALYRPIKRSVAQFYSVKPYSPDGALRLLDAPLSAYTSSTVFFYSIANDLGIFIQNSTPSQAIKGTEK